MAGVAGGLPLIGVVVVIVWLLGKAASAVNRQEYRRSRREYWERKRVEWDRDDDERRAGRDPHPW